MSTTYRPRNKRVAKTPWSYKDGGFDANVDGAQWLGQVHEYLQLPLADRRHIEDPPRVPWQATAAQCRRWAERIRVALDVFRVDPQSGHHYLVAWCEFLATCGGYRVDP